jgi:RNA polymerase sigma-70 factor (ECF subfamily)
MCYHAAEVLTKKRREEFKEVIEGHWKRVYNFSFRMTLDHERASSVTEEAFLRAYVGSENLPEGASRVEQWLLRIANHILEQRLPRTPEVSFDLLDETLRSEATRTDVVRSLTDPQRDFMLWELKQGCMTSVINCLSPGERAAFIMASVLKLPEEEAATALNITKSAYKVRLSRARKKVGDYLAPRCEHVNPNNPCRCPARVGVALRKGFIKQAGEVSLRRPVMPFGRYGSGPDTEDAPLRDVEAIYSHLPDPDAPENLESHLLGQLESGKWDKVRDRKH